MSTTVDARGLSCPQPVLKTLDEIKAGETNDIEVLVDTDTSKENVTRAAHSQGWKIADISEDSDGFKVRIRKG